MERGDTEDTWALKYKYEMNLKLGKKWKHKTRTQFIKEEQNSLVPNYRHDNMTNS